jgi:uncharacterized protein with beta-barrel porin domain
MPITTIKNQLVSITLASSIVFNIPYTANASFDILNGQTVTSTETLDPGDIGTIQAGGSLKIEPISPMPSPVVGIRASSNNTINNMGTVGVNISFAAEINTILVNGSNNSIINNGTIYALSSNPNTDSTVILVHGNSNIITNIGTITTNATNRVTNSNTLGLLFIGNNNTINNNGDISIISNGNAIGIGLVGNDNVFINNKNIIITTNNNAVGIITNGNNNNFSNSGIIIANGSSASNSIAVDFRGQFSPNTANNTLNYYTNGYMSGRIRFGNGNGNALNVINTNNDRSHLITYEGNATATVTGNIPYVTGNNQVATISQTGFAMANEMSTQISRDTQAMITNRLGQSPRIKHSYNYWADAFGSYQQRPNSGSIVKSDNTVGGILVGFDRPIREDDVAGLFVGGVKGRFRAGNPNNQTSQSNGAIIGAYSYIQLPQNSFLDLMLNVGYINHSNNRLVYNNLTTTGTETINSSYNEIYFTPSATLGRKFDYSSFSVVPSVTARYTGQFIDGYTEQGSSQAVQNVGSRYLNTVSGRGQISLQKHLDKQNLNTEIRAGVEAQSIVGKNKVTVNLIGQQVRFTPGGPKQYIDGFIGGSINSDLKAKGVNAFADMELSKGINHSSSHNYAIALKAGVTVNF